MFENLDETELIYAIVTDGCGNLFLLDANRDVLDREPLLTDDEAELMTAVNTMLNRIVITD